MYVLDPAPRWSWPVRVRIPADGGRIVEQVFDAQFVLVPDERIRTLTDADPGGARLLEAALVGWSGVVDQDQRAVPFSDSSRALLTSIPFVRAALLEAYRDGLTGAARKN